MPSLDFEMPRKTLPIILAISKTTDNAFAEMVCDSILDFFSMMKEKENDSPDFRAKAITYVLGSETEYLSGSLFELEQIEPIISSNLKSSNDKVNLTDFFVKLENILSRKKLFSDLVGYKRPIMIFIFDGKNDYVYDSLNCIKNNKWFNNAIKIGILFNENSKEPRNILTDITGTTEAVLDASNMDMLKDLIIPISLMGSIIPSNSLQDDDLIRVDPISENSNLFNAVLDTGVVNIDGETNIHLCQICACHPQNALDTMFTLVQESETIKVRFFMDALIEFNIVPYGKFEISDCFDLNAINCESLGLHINQLSNCIIIENNSSHLCSLRVPVKNGQERTLKENDRILDSNGKCLIEIKKVFDDLPGSTGGEIPWNNDDITWD